MWIVFYSLKSACEITFAPGAKNVNYFFIYTVKHTYNDIGHFPNSLTYAASEIKEKNSDMHYYLKFKLSLHYIKKTIVNISSIKNKINQ